MDRDFAIRTMPRGYDLLDHIIRLSFTFSSGRCKDAAAAPFKVFASQDVFYTCSLARLPFRLSFDSDPDRSKSANQPKHIHCQEIFERSNTNSLEKNLFNMSPVRMNDKGFRVADIVRSFD